MFAKLADGAVLSEPDFYHYTRSVLKILSMFTFLKVIILKVLAFLSTIL